MADAGFKLTVEGEREFRKAISDINVILRLNQAELQKVTAEYNAGEKSMEAMKKRQESLGGVIEKQTAILAQMQAELTRLTDTYGENDRGTIKMRTEVEKASASLASMQAQFRANAEEIEKAAKAAEEMAKATEELEKAAAAAEELEKVKKAAEESAKTMADADAQITAFSAELRAIESAAEDGGDSLSLFGKKSEETEKKVKSLTEQNELLEKTVEQHKKKLDLLNDEMSEAVRLYGDQSREVAEYRTQIANTQTEVQELTKKIDANNDEIENAESKALDLEGVFSQISDITGIQIPDGITKMVGGIDNAKLAAGGLVGVVAGIAIELKKAMEAAETFGRELKKTANEAGLTTTETMELMYIAEKMGVEFDGVADIIKNLREKMYEASNGNQEFAEEFESLEVDVHDTNGELREAQEVLFQLVEKYGEMSNETERAARMQKILGDNSKLLNSFIESGAEALSAYREEAHKTGYVIEDELADAANEAAKKTEDLNRAIEVFQRNMGAAAIKTRQDIFSKGFSVEREIENQESAVKALKNLLNILWQKITGNYATGTYNHPGGYALVGERGPEIVDLPAGSRVYPNGEYPAGGTVNYYNVSINASDVKEFNDIVRLAQSKRVTERMK